MTPRSRPKASASNLITHHHQQQQALPVLGVPPVNRSPTPSTEQQSTTLSNSSKNSVSSGTTEDQSVTTTITKIASLTNLNQAVSVSAPTSTIVTPVLDSKYTSFGDQLDQSKNPFTTQQTFSNDSLAQQFNEKLNCSSVVVPSHRRNASEASFLNKQFNQNSINNSVNLQTSTGSLSSGHFVTNKTQLNPFDDSFTNEQVIDHWFDELGKRDEDKRKYHFSNKFFF